jgi:DNA-binding transcriptional ArsR family regulator
MAQRTGCHRALEEFLGPRFHIRVHRGKSAFRGLARQISVCLCDDMIENDLFKALADPTRRAIFAKLATGGMNASALREGMEISQPAMSQHLAVLRNARLVREQRRGRFVNYVVDPDGLALIARWLVKYRAYWPRRVDALKTLLKDMDQ